MLHPIDAAAALLLQVAQLGRTLPDTLVTKQVMTEPGIFTKITTVASGLMTVALLVLAVALTPAAWNFRKTYKKVNELIDKVYGDFQPLVRNASVVADDAREIMTIVKGDVRQVQQTVAAANARLLKAVRDTERRIDEFNALLEVVQDEAEETFVTTAAAVRGVRTGLQHALEPAGLEGSEEDELDGRAEPDEPDEPLEELTDGDYGEGRGDRGGRAGGYYGYEGRGGTSGRGGTGPRIRPRPPGEPA